MARTTTRSAIAAVAVLATALAAAGCASRTKSGCS